MFTVCSLNLLLLCANNNFQYDCSTVPALHIYSCTEVRSRNHIKQSSKQIIQIINQYITFLSSYLKPRGVRETRGERDRMKPVIWINRWDTKWNTKDKSGKVRGIKKTDQLKIEKRGTKSHSGITTEERRVIQSMEGKLRASPGTSTGPQQRQMISSLKNNPQLTPVNITRTAGQGQIRGYQWEKKRKVRWKCLQNKWTPLY